MNPRLSSTRTRVSAALPFVTAGLVCLLMAGCGTPKKQETASLAQAVERFQHAENAARPETAPVVAAVKCTDAEVREVCDLCAAAATATGRAITIKTQVEHDLGELQAGRLSHEAAVALDLDQKLVESMRLLEEGRAKMNACDERLGALKRKVGI